MLKNILKLLYDEILNISNKYFELTDTPEAINISESRIEMGDATEMELEHEDILYRENNAISFTFVKETYNKLLVKIRKELKTNGSNCG